MADSQDTATPRVSSNQAGNLIDASVPYELKEGCVYLIEVKNWALSKTTARYIAEYYQKRWDIDIHFVFTTGSDFALQAVPGVVADDAGNDLLTTDPETKNRKAEAQ